MKPKIMLEASGSLVAGWVIKAVKESGCVAVASDITSNSVGRFLADEFVVVPSKDDPGLWEKLEHMILAHKIDVIIPSLDETLMLWSRKKEYLKGQFNIDVIISDEMAIEVFTDKYKTFEFFVKNGIPSPKVSLEKDYPVWKPRFGRGSKGIVFRPNATNEDFDGMISQELLEGEEYTVDCLIDHNGRPVYIVPRKRSKVSDGKSIDGLVVNNPEIVELVEIICDKVQFFGPINIQCFETSTGIKFTEVNPRIGGGTALAFAATENWIKLVVEKLIKQQTIIEKKEILYNLSMHRYYEEIFV